MWVVDGGRNAIERPLLARRPINRIRLPPKTAPCATLRPQRSSCARGSAVS